MRWFLSGAIAGVTGLYVALVVRRRVDATRFLASLINDDCGCDDGAQ